jgi:tetratricopeptide (TPR) repeat protein
MQSATGGNMAAQSLVTSVSIKILTNFVHDLLRRIGGTPAAPIDIAITKTVERFPNVEGLKGTLEEWLASTGVITILEEYAKGLKGFDPVKVDALSATLLRDTRFFLADGADAVAHDIVSWFLAAMREQYLMTPELGIAHVANRVEDVINVSTKGFETLKTDLQALRDALPDLLPDVGVNGPDLQIDRARDHLQRHELELAKQACERLRQSSWDRLNSRQRFRVLSNLATVSLRQGKLGEATRLFMEAKPLQPDDPVALANEAFAHYLLKEGDRAFALATCAKELFPSSTQVLTVWLAAAPNSLSMHDLEGAVPSHLSSDVEVIMALARRALLARDNSKAEAWARQATVIKPDWSYPWAVLGESIFRSMLPDTSQDYVRRDTPGDKARLTAAAEACTSAIELSKHEKQFDLQAGILLIRAEVRRFLGDPAGGDDDVSAAWSLRPDDPTVLRDYARLKLQHGQKRDAIEKLRPAVKDGGADVRMVFAAALSSTGDLNDRAEGTEVYLSIASDPSVDATDFKTEAIIGAMDNLARDERWVEGRAVLAELPGNTVSLPAHSSMQGGLELAAGNRENAAEFAIKALGEITATTSRDDLRLVATLLADLGRQRDALPLWERLSSPARLGYDTRRLIDCTLRLGEHAKFLTLCEHLRSNGIFDSRLIEVEAGVREQYDIEGTIGLLQEYLNRSPDNKSARLQLSVIGVQLGRHELISSDSGSLPSPDETAPENWKAIVRVIKSGGHLWAALLFAYRVLRLYFGNVEAHRAYMAALMPTEPLPPIPTVEVVGAGTAVAFREEGLSQIEWRVIEEDFEPDVNLQEIGPGHFTAGAATGWETGG